MLNCLFICVLYNLHIYFLILMEIKFATISKDTSLLKIAHIHKSFFSINMRIDQERCWERKRCTENHCSVLRDENLRQRVKGRECNSPLSRRASVGPRGWGFSRGNREGPGASSPESKEVRNVFMIFPG